MGSYVLVEKELLLRLARQPLSSDEFRVVVALIAVQSMEVDLDVVKGTGKDGEPTG